VRLGLIVAAALALRVAYVVLLAGDRYLPGPTGDSMFFHEIAGLLADGHGFRSPYPPADLALTAEHPPLWPHTLAAFSALGFENILAHRLVGALIGTGSVGLIGLLGARFAGERGGLLAASVAAAHPVLIAADGSMLSETLFGMLVLASLLAAVGLRDRPSTLRAVMLGVLVGLAALARGEGLALIALLAVPAAWGPRRGRPVRVAAVTLVAVVVLLPWTARNWTKFDRPVLVSTNAGTLLRGANCKSTYHGDLLGFWDVNCLRHSTEENEARRSAIFAEDGIRYAGDHFTRLGVVVPVRLLRGANLWRPAQQIRLAEGRVRWVEAVGQGLSLLLLPLAVYGAVLLRRRRDPLGLLLAPAAVSVAVIVFGYGYPRFRFTADLVAVVLAGAAAAMLLERRRSA
jgi:4-amino-4-deoxy-L-arabinose transferase-like glycosyltransferase